MCDERLKKVVDIVLQYGGYEVRQLRLVLRRGSNWLSGSCGTSMYR